MTSHYETLQVEPLADAGAITRAFRARMRQAHPDAGGSHDEAAKILAAYEVLQDPDRRSAYDATLTRAQHNNGSSETDYENDDYVDEWGAEHPADMSADDVDESDLWGQEVPIDETHRQPPHTEPWPWDTGFEPSPNARPSPRLSRWWLRGNGTAVLIARVLTIVTAIALAALPVLQVVGYFIEPSSRARWIDDLIGMALLTAILVGPITRRAMGIPRFPNEYRVFILLFIVAPSAVALTSSINRATSIFVLAAGLLLSATAETRNFAIRSSQPFGRR